MEFANHFNRRDPDGLWSLYSERIRDAHSYKEVVKAVNDAYDKIILNVHSFNEFEKDNRTVVVANTSILNGEIHYQLLNFSFDYTDSQPRVDNWVLDSLVDLKGSE